MNSIGTTAVTVILLDDHMIISNVGDSEAVVCRDGTAVQLSTLHTPVNEKEKQRVSTYPSKYHKSDEIT